MVFKGSSHQERSFSHQKNTPHRFHKTNTKTTTKTSPKPNKKQQKTAEKTTQKTTQKHVKKPLKNSSRNAQTLLRNYSTTAQKVLKNCSKSTQKMRGKDPTQRVRTLSARRPHWRLLCRLQRRGLLGISLCVLRG